MKKIIISILLLSFIFASACNQTSMNNSNSRVIEKEDKKPINDEEDLIRKYSARLFNELDKTEQKSFINTGQKNEEGGEIYTNGDIELLLMDDPSGFKRIYDIYIVNDRHETDRGLKVGDSREKCEKLYNGISDTGTLDTNETVPHIKVEFESGKVSKIVYFILR